MQAKLGDQAVHGLVVQDDFRPELASHYTSPLLNVEGVSRLHSLRPSLLLAKPRQLQEKVTLLHGPERISTGWWDSQEVVRDYFVARSEQGQWCWCSKPQTPSGFCTAYLVKSTTLDITHGYAELFCQSNFSFLQGASHPQELVMQAHFLGYQAIAITDECSVAGVVRAHAPSKITGSISN